MRKLLRARRREGFSLIELLIVVAIIAALVGVAVPFFQDNLSEAQRSKAGEDLEVIKKSISLYDARESRPLVGSDLSPLLGRYMQELPKDPWGNDYLFDGAAGFLCSYGADALPEGTGGDTDIPVYTRPELMISRVQYAGSWGAPNAPRASTTATVASFSKKNGNKFVISLTKPATVADANIQKEIVLLTRAGNDGILGGHVSLEASGTPNWVASTWISGGLNGGFSAPDRLHKPAFGKIVLRCNTINYKLPGGAQSITPTMALDFANSSADTGGADILATAVAVGTSIAESSYTDGRSPLDQSVYGADAGNYNRPPQSVSLVSNVRQGVRIEKY
jgi:general secretion pathway protein G